MTTTNTDDRICGIDSAPDYNIMSPDFVHLPLYLLRHTPASLIRQLERVCRKTGVLATESGGAMAEGKEPERGCRGLLTK